MKCSAAVPQYRRDARSTHDSRTDPRSSRSAGTDDWKCGSTQASVSVARKSPSKVLIHEPCSAANIFERQAYVLVRPDHQNSRIETGTRQGARQG